MPALSRRPGLVASVLLVLGAFGAFFLFAGNLEPPGPPAPTMKTLDDVEPRFGIRNSDLPMTITVPGSYYLLEDISTAPGGITIGTLCVTIDLNGFALYGGFAAGSGIVANANTQNIEIRNGAVAEWVGDGIDLSNASNSRVIDVRVVGNLGDGIVLGAGSVVKNSLVNDNSGEGIRLSGQGNVVRDCTINGNATGVLAEDELNQIVGNSVIANATGIQAAETVANNLIIVDNLVQGNTTIGINLGEFTTGHITSRNLALSTSGTNYPFKPADFGPQGTAETSTSPWANISD